MAEKQITVQQKICNAVSALQSDACDQEKVPGRNLTWKEVKELVQIPPKLIPEIAEGLIEREEEAKVAVLALISGEHAIFVGPPGTAKSEVEERFAKVIQAKRWQYTFDKYTEKDEVVGPRDIAAFRKRGEYKRVIENTLEDSEIGCLNELFNADGTILNCLNDILNERVFHDANVIIKANLLTAIAATNHMPEPGQGQVGNCQDLDAFVDRFELRHFVKPVSENKDTALQEAARNIRFNGRNAVDSIATVDQLKKIRNEVLALVEVPIEIEEANTLIKQDCESSKTNRMIISDRRLGRVQFVEAAHALIHGRLKVTEKDLVVWKYIAPYDESDVEEINKILPKYIESSGTHMEELNDMSKNFAGAKKDLSDVPSNPGMQDVRVIPKIEQVNLGINRINIIIKTCDEEDEDVKLRATEVMDQANELKKLLSNRLQRQ
jgi:MoxR-like ATPase